MWKGLSDGRNAPFRCGGEKVTVECKTALGPPLTAGWFCRFQPLSVVPFLQNGRFQLHSL